MDANRSSKSRRDILSAAGAGIVAATAISSAAIGATSKKRTGIRVLKGESRDGSPLTIKGNPFVSIKVLPSDTVGRHLLIALATPPGLGPEMHIHTSQSEWFYVVEGRIGLECDGVRVVLGRGDSYLVPAGAAHAYVTLGESVAHLLNLFDPGGSMLHFFADYAAVLNRPGPPNAAALKQIYEAHGMKVVGPPLNAAAFS